MGERGTGKRTVRKNEGRLNKAQTLVSSVSISSLTNTLVWDVDMRETRGLGTGYVENSASLQIFPTVKAAPEK